MLENIDWKLVAILIPIAMALTEFVKQLAKDKLGQWSILVSVVFGFLTVFLLGSEPFMWRPFVQMGIFVGLGATGLYNGTTQIGYAIVKAATVKTVIKDSESKVTTTVTATIDKIDK